MAREQRGSLIAFVFACVAHVALVAWMTRIERAAVDPGIAMRVMPKPEPAPLIAPPPPLVPPQPQDTPIGEATGQGESIARVDLPDVAQSRQPREIEQAWTRQRPSLSPPSPVPPDESTAQPMGPAAPTEMVAPAPKPPEQSPEGTFNAADPETPPMPEPAEAEVAKPQREPTPEAVAAASPSAATPSPPNPGETGESDLDPFAKAEGVDFKPGGIEARTGRPVKLVRPRIDLGYMVDATVLRGRKTTILLKIETDSTGTPTKVDVVKSSGSRQIDDAIRLAMYSSYFGGKMPDAFPFGITLWQ